MSSSGDDSFAASPGNIHSVLVRRLPDGHVLRCGTVHDIPVARGETLVVQTATGIWLAECLVVDTKPTDGSLAGELLRVANERDRDRAREAMDVADKLRTAAANRVQTTSASVVIIAAEVDLQQDSAVVRFLGRPDEQMGPLAVRLADEWGLQRVQWTAIDTTAESKAGAESVSEMSPADALEQEFWERFDEVNGNGEAHGQSLGKAFRVSAGNRGLYQQKRRGPSPQKRHLTSGRSWMLRVRTAAGGITASQLCKMMELAQQHADGTLRLTIRQAIQLHGVTHSDCDQLMQQLGQRLLTSMGSCGNAVRNLTCCPLPIHQDPSRCPGQREVRELALRLARDLLPRGPAFEFRVADQRRSPLQTEFEAPSKTTTELPHKFKVGVASDRHDCADVLTNDLAFVVRTDTKSPARRAGDVDIYVGGSTSYRADDRNSFPHLALWLGTVSIRDALAAAEMLIAMFARRDAPASRHFRRWKYVVHRTGIDTLADQFRQQSQGTVELHRQSPAVLGGGHVGFTAANGSAFIASNAHADQGRTADGLHWLRLAPPQGRLVAEHLPTLQQLRDADATVRVGTSHDLIATFSSPAAVQPWPVPTHRGRVCPALPTCSLAVAAAETQWAVWSDAVLQASLRAGVYPPELSVSGCANGCSRPLTTAIGLVAERPDCRAVYLGGSPLRLGMRVGTIATAEQFAHLLVPWLTQFRAEMSHNENFADWFWRTQRK